MSRTSYGLHLCILVKSDVAEASSEAPSSHVGLFACVTFVGIVEAELFDLITDVITSACSCQESWADSKLQGNSRCQLGLGNDAALRNRARLQCTLFPGKHFAGVLDYFLFTSNHAETLWLHHLKSKHTC